MKIVRRSPARRRSRSRTASSTRRSSGCSKGSSWPPSPPSSSGIRPRRDTPNGWRAAPWASPRWSTGWSDGPYRTCSSAADQIREIRYAGAAARFRQGGRARAGAGQGEEALLGRSRRTSGSATPSSGAAPNGDSKRTAPTFCWLTGRGLRGFRCWSCEAGRTPTWRWSSGFFDVVLESNKPTVLAEGNFEQLNELGQRDLRRHRRTPSAFLE